MGYGCLSSRSASLYWEMAAWMKLVMTNVDVIRRDSGSRLSIDKSPDGWFYRSMRNFLYT